MLTRGFSGLKNYIASETLGISTSAGLVRNLFGRCIQLGRQYARSGNKSDLYEALRLLGTGCHCLEDYAAHSNYVELALIELGERDVFPFVGRQTQVRLPRVSQPVYPIITGTFGGTDFLLSVIYVSPTLKFGHPTNLSYWRVLRQSNSIGTPGS